MPKSSTTWINFPSAFYEGLLQQDIMFLDVVVRGSVMDKTPSQARKLICNMVGGFLLEYVNDNSVVTVSRTEGARANELVELTQEMSQLLERLMLLS